MTFATQARADRRGLLGAAFMGAGMGLGLGALYLHAGIADQVAQRDRALAMADAAAGGYAGSYLETRGRGLSYGLQQYGLRASLDAQRVSARYANERGPAKARGRADLECMADAVYYEARGESANGQYAVAQVVMNRVKHPAFPKSVCAVVFQGAGRSGCQFSFACDGSMRQAREAAAWARARKVAGRALAGVVVANVGHATHFHTTAVSPFWAPQMLRVSQVGTHVFYRFSPNRLHLSPSPALIQRAVLTASNATTAADLKIAPTLAEAAIESSLQPPAESRTRAPPTSKPAEAAQLTSPQPVVVAAS